MSNGTGGFDDPAGLDPRWEQEERERRAWEEANPSAPLQPFNVEAEAALLGALMIDNRLVDGIGSLTKEDFYEPVHGRIFAKIVDLVHAEKNANPISLRPFFEADEELNEHFEGVAYFATLTASSASVIGARDFAKQVRDLAQLRRIYQAATKIAARALDTSEDIDPAALVAELETEVSEIGVQADTIPSSTFAEAWDKLDAEFKEIEDGKEPAGFTIKLFKDWNAIVGRMEEADLIYVGARPGMGKTAVACAVACGAAAAGEPTEFFSLEMDERKLTRRMLANLIFQDGVTSTYSHISAGKLTMADRRSMQEQRELLDNWPLHISYPSHMNVEDLAPAIRRRQRQLARKGETLKLVVVDYLGRFGTFKKFKSETEEISYISRVLKATAKVCKVALIVLVQLSRAVEARDNKRPMLADLRQSGSLEQDADSVVFIYRDEYYLERAEPPKDKAEKWSKWADELASVRDVMELYSSKRREGPLLKKLSKFFTTFQAVRDHDFFAWKSHASPIGPQDDGPDFFGKDSPEQRGA